jgi:hypothetical protein
LETRPEWSARPELDSAIRSAFDAFLRAPEWDSFPSTFELARFAQSSVRWRPEDPDSVIEQALAAESSAFAMLETEMINRRLSTGFSDADDFVHYAIRVQQRRKARRGRSLENHLEWIFRRRGLRFVSQARPDEGGSSVDFLFPDVSTYHDRPEPISVGVVMLGAKSTCKDRWRQLLSEARKLRKRHLFTLESAISSRQTCEMGESNVSLVVPQSQRGSYKDPGTEILTLAEFIEHVEANV